MGGGEEGASKSSMQGKVLPPDRKKPGKKKERASPGGLPVRKTKKTVPHRTVGGGGKIKKRKKN